MFRVFPVIELVHAFGVYGIDRCFTAFLGFYRATQLC